MSYMFLSRIYLYLYALYLLNVKCGLQNYFSIFLSGVIYNTTYVPPLAHARGLFMYQYMQFYLFDFWADITRKLVLWLGLAGRVIFNILYIPHFPPYIWNISSRTYLEHGRRDVLRGSTAPLGIFGTPTLWKKFTTIYLITLDFLKPLFTMSFRGVDLLNTICLRACAFFLSLRGKPNMSETNNHYENLSLAFPPSSCRFCLKATKWLGPARGETRRCSLDA